MKSVNQISDNLNDEIAPVTALPAINLRMAN